VNNIPTATCIDATWVKLSWPDGAEAKMSAAFDEEHFPDEWIVSGEETVRAWWSDTYKWHRTLEKRHQSLWACIWSKVTEALC
jgi:hypothetical protein